MRARVAVTGLGCVSGLGQGTGANWARALAGEGAIRPFALPRAPIQGAPAVAGPAAPVDALDPSAAEARFGERVLRGLDPLVAYALLAGLEAVAAAGLADEGDVLARAAVLVGCGSGGNATFESAYARVFGRGSPRVHPQTIPAAMISAPASVLAGLLGVRGPAMGIASACASSAHAIGEGMAMIRSGRAAVVLAGGAEASLPVGAWAGWASLGAMAPDTCRPFSADRRGLVLGEGAAMLVLEDMDHAHARGAPILAELTGYAAASAPGPVTVPDAGAIAGVLRAGLADADLSPGAGALIAAHGTGTPLNDAAEAAAIRAVWGADLDRATVIATKSAHGHLIGAAGAIGLVLAIRALAAGAAPPILNHLGADPGCDLPLALGDTPIAHGHAVASSFAFGGLNAVLVARAA